jgi:hypothetical protein
MPEKQHRPQETTTRTAWAAYIGAARHGVKCEIAEKFTFFVSFFAPHETALQNSATAIK